MRQVPCILGPCSNDISGLHYLLYWDHLSLYGHMERTEIVNQSSRKMGDPWKDLESGVAANLLCNWRFLKQQNGYSYRKCMATLLKVPRDFILDGLLIQNVANIQSVNAFISEFDIQKRAVPCFCRFTDPDSFEKKEPRDIPGETSGKYGQVWEKWSQQLKHMQVPNSGGIRCPVG